MHAPAQLYQNGSKFTKIAIVAALHIGLVAGVMNSKIIINSLPKPTPPVYVPPLKPVTPPTPATPLSFANKSVLPTITPVDPLDIKIERADDTITPPKKVEVIGDSVKTHTGGPDTGTGTGTGTGNGTGAKVEPRIERTYSAALANADACTLPAYPARSVREGSEGTVTLSLLIGTDGKVSASRVQKSSGFPELDRAAVAALKLCTFKPATVNGVPESAWGQIAYVWTLD